MFSWEGVGAEAAGAAAEIAGRFMCAPGRDRDRVFLDGDVDEPHELPRLLTLVGDLFVGDDDEIADFSNLVLGKFGNRHTNDREGSVRAIERRQLEPADFGI